MTRKLVAFLCLSSFFGEGYTTMEHVYVAILAGGKGERLWPLSTVDRPKPLLPFINGETLLDQTIQRALPLVDSPKNICIVAGAGLEALIQKEVGDRIGFMITEPCGRNTAAAVLLAVEQIYRRDPDALVLFLSADHFIPDPVPFQAMMRHAIDYTKQHQKIAIFGLKPQFPATGYGYIQTGVPEEQGFIVDAFHEKPDLEQAQKYVKQSNMFWNLGLFAAQASVWRAEFSANSPEIFAGMQRYLDGNGSYQDITSISVDYALMEKSKNIVMFGGNFAWYDVGNLHAFLSLKKIYGGQYQDVINIQAQNNLAQTKKKIVACIGVSNICIIETADVLVIAHNDEVERVKQALGKVNEMEAR
jgi:mannose-1-phosphate guanylyltransferase/mannose-6-phosphate isomerase